MKSLLIPHHLAVKKPSDTLWAHHHLPQRWTLRCMTSKKRVNLQPIKISNHWRSKVGCGNELLGVPGSQPQILKTWHNYKEIQVISVYKKHTKSKVKYVFIKILDRMIIIRYYEGKETLDACQVYSRLFGPGQQRSRTWAEDAASLVIFKLAIVLVKLSLSLDLQIHPFFFPLLSIFLKVSHTESFDFFLELGAHETSLA